MDKADEVRLRHMLDAMRDAVGFATERKGTHSTPIVC